MNTTTQGWKSWSIGDWNGALINAVFLDTEASSSRISRIDTTDPFIARSTGDEATDGAEARKVFLRCFGTNASEINALFRLRGDENQATKKLGFPPYFAQLYLSLLAASADEATYQEGDFRERLALLLHLPGEPHLRLDDLARMWAKLAQWTERRAASKADCRVLVLPDPGWETIIGHAKRLAFPGFRDQDRLARLLSDRGLSGEAEFKQVVKAVNSKLAQFTEGFTHEFSQFRDMVREGKNAEAYDTPFWCAVRDVTWESERAEAKRAGRLRAEIEVDEVCAYIRLYADESAAKVLGAGLSARKVRRAGGCDLLVLPNGHSGWNPSALAMELGKHAEFQAKKLASNLRSGFLLLLPDDLGRLASDGNFVEGSHACVLLVGSNRTAMESLCKHLNVRWQPVWGETGWDSWKGFYFPRLTRVALQRFATDFPAVFTSSTRWRPPRPTVTGGAWVGQAVLLNPATALRVWIAEAGAASFVLRDSLGEELSRGGLAPGEEDNEYRVPHHALATVGEGGRLLLSNRTGSGQEWTSSLQVVCTVDEALPARLESPERWVMEDELGGITPIGVRGAGFFPSPGQSVRSEGRPNGRLLDQPLRHVERQAFSSVSSRPLAERAPPFNWLGEVLSARLLARQSLPWSELGPHLEAAGEAVGLSSRGLSRLLVAAGWLLQVEQASSPHLHYIPKPLAMTVSEGSGRVHARISGILPAASLHVLLQLLGPGESASEMVDSDNPWCLGVITLDLPSMQRAQVIASRLGIQNIVTSKPRGPYAVFGSAVLATKSSPSDIGNEPGLELFAPESFEWHWCSRGELPDVALVRRTGFPRNRYWVKWGGNCWMTFSMVWARLLLNLARGCPAGTLAKNGDCVLDRGLLSLPQPIIAWWRDWEGGLISLSKSGELVLSGGKARDDWLCWPGWSQEEQARPSVVPLPVLRRKLAIQLRKRAAAGFPASYNNNVVEE